MVPLGVSFGPLGVCLGPLGGLLLDAHLGPSVGSLVLVVRLSAVGAAWEPLGDFLGFSWGLLGGVFGARGRLRVDPGRQPLRPS